MHLPKIRFTPLLCAILVVSLAQLGVSVSTIVLENKLQGAFRNEQFQYPNSSLREFLFVPLSPSNTAMGPTIAKFVVSACSMLSAALAVAWAVWHAARPDSVNTRILAGSTCTAAVANAVAAIGLLVYIFVRESKNALPSAFREWAAAEFTQEFYVCVAIPSLFAHPTAIYGFSACKTAHAALYFVIAICCTAVILAGLSVIQVIKDKASKGRRVNAERGGHETRPAVHTNGVPQQQMHLLVVPHPAATSNPQKMEPPPSNIPLPASIHGYYGKC